MRTFARIAAIVAVPLAAVCAPAYVDRIGTSGHTEAFASGPDIAGIFVYCSGCADGAAPIDVELDGRAIGSISARCYVRAELKPGTHVVVVPAGDGATLEVVAAGGENRYVAREDGEAAAAGRERLRVVGEDEGREAIRAGRLAPAPQTPGTPDSKAAQVAKGVIIGVAIVTLIALVAFAAAVAAHGIAIPMMPGG